MEKKDSLWFDEEDLKEIRFIARKLYKDMSSSLRDKGRIGCNIHKKMDDVDVRKLRINPDTGYRYQAPPWRSRWDDKKKVSDEVLSKNVEFRLKSGELEVVLKSYGRAVERLESLKKAGCSGLELVGAEDVVRSLKGLLPE